MKKLFSLLLLFVLALSTTNVFALDYVFHNDVEDPWTVDEIANEIVATDDIDGDISDQITVLLDNYTGNESILGDYLVYYEVRDSGNQVTQQIVTVRNVDVNAPVITYDEEGLNIPEDSAKTLSSLNLVAIDGFEGDLTNNISVTGWDGVDTSTIGSYNILVNVSDSSGNETTENLTINVVDDVLPTIEGPDLFVKRADVILTADFFTDYYTAEDDRDGVITGRIEISSNEYEGNADNPGTYEVELSVSDIQGNEQVKTITIRVVEDMIPKLVIDNYYFVVDNDYLITDDDFVTILKDVDDLPNNTFIFTTNSDDYTENYTELGSYEKSFSLQSSGGSDYERTIILEVVDAADNIVDSEPMWIVEHWKAAIAIFFVVSLVSLGIYGAIKGK